MQDTKLTPQQINRIIEPARRAPLSQVYEACLKDNSGSTLRTMRKIDYLKIKELEQLYYDNLSASNCPIDIEWELLTEIDDDNLKTTALNAFVRKFATSATAEAERYMEKASELFGILAEEIAIHEDWVNAMHENTIVAYKNYIAQHPNSRYQSEAEITIRALKKDLLKDMKRNPCGYSREVVHDYIRSGILSYDELVVENHLLTTEAYRHIIRYPSLMEEQTCLPLRNNAIPYSCPGNVDVLFLGVSGSGGKTCLLASLMSLFDDSNFKLKPIEECLDNTYAHYLADYMLTNRLPPATITSYVQVIDTELRVDNNCCGVSFVEFAGEKVAEMAGNDSGDGFSAYGFKADDSSSIEHVFKNDNKKILFFSIDPTNLKSIQIYRDEDWVSQDALFLMLTKLLGIDECFCRKVIGIHVIVTKKDCWEDKINKHHTLMDLLYGQGYYAFISSLNTVCNQHGIAKRNQNTIDIIPFSIGKFLIGGTYKFDNTDAKKILELIREDMSDYCKTNRAISSMTSKQIEAVRSGKVSMQQLMDLCVKGDRNITIDSLRVLGYPKIKQLEEMYYRELLNPSDSGQFQSIEAEWKMLKSLPFDSKKEMMIQDFVQKLYLENTEYARGFRKKVEAYWEELLEENRLKGCIFYDE